jgi:hypothetical protein
LLALLVVALVFQLTPRPNVIVSSDGSELELTAVTDGTRHVYPGRGMKNRVLSLLPDKLRRKFGSRGAAISTPNTNVVFWFERSGGEMPLVMVSDDSGFGVAQSFCAVSAGTGDAWIEGVGFNVVPRRDRELFVRLFVRTNATEPGPMLGEFRVPNPLSGVYPTWVPASLPAKRETNGLAITLHELTAGVRWNGAIEPGAAARAVDAAIRAVFTILENGALTDEWTPIGIETSDATGNRLQHQSWKSRIENERHIVHYRWGLWPSEAAWKLNVQIARRAGFAADQLWSVRGLALTGADPVTGPTCRADLQGASLELHRIRAEDYPKGWWAIHVRVQPFRGDYRLSLVEAVDDIGRKVPNTGESSSNGDCTFDLKPEPSAQSLNLIFALHQTYCVEFIVKPTAPPFMTNSSCFPTSVDSATKAPR